MKYLKKFQTNADYQTFKGSDDWITPNVSLIEEEIPVVIYSIAPITLIEGENGELGVALYEYLNGKYGTVTKTHLTIDETFVLHVETPGFDNEITSNKIASEKDGYCLYHGAGSAFILNPTGKLYYHSYEPV